MSDDVLKRIDRHMERGNEIMDRVENEMRLSREQHAEHMRQTQEALRGYRVAINQVLRMGEENREAFRDNREAMRENREAMHDMREEIRANTKAVLALLDRFQNGGAGPATA